MSQKDFETHRSSPIHLHPHLTLVAAPLSTRPQSFGPPPPKNSSSCLCRSRLSYLPHTTTRDFAGTGACQVTMKEGTVKLISVEGFEFVIDMEAAMFSHTIRQMLTSPAGFAESHNREVRFPQIGTSILEKICQYFYWALHHQRSKFWPLPTDTVHTLAPPTTSATPSCHRPHQAHPRAVDHSGHALHPPSTAPTTPSHRRPLRPCPTPAASCFKDSDHALPPLMTPTTPLIPLGWILVSSLPV